MTFKQSRRPGELHPARLVVYDDEIHLDWYADDPLVVGSIVEVIRGNGPREGDRMGSATVTGFEDDGPVLYVHLEGDEREAA